MLNALDNSTNKIRVTRNDPQLTTLKRELQRFNSPNSTKSHCVTHHIYDPIKVVRKKKSDKKLNVEGRSNDVVIKAITKAENKLTKMTA